MRTLNMKEMGCLLRRYVFNIMYQAGYEILSSLLKANCNAKTML